VSQQIGATVQTNPRFPERQLTT